MPEIFTFDTARDLYDSDYFFMEKLAGENFEHVKTNLTPQVHAQIDRSVGAIIRAINGFTGTYFGYDGNPDLCADTWKAVGVDD